MINASHAGFCAVWDWNRNRPIKSLPPREAVPTEYTIYAGQWQEGYDDGMALVNAYRAGRTAYEVGEKRKAPAGGQNEVYAWCSGWNDARRKAVIKAVRPILQAVAGKIDKVLATTHYPDYDHIEGTETKGGTKYEHVKKADVMAGCLDFFTDRWGHDKPLPTTLDDCLTVLVASREGDGSWCSCSLTTAAQVRKDKAEQKFKEMEGIANEFASSCGFPAGTMKFIRALEKAVRNVKDQRESWNNPEVRMEEWAACQYAGVGSEVYFDDLNFENGRFSTRLDNLQKVWDYLERKFPLMMLRYQEAKERRKAKK